MKKIKKYLELNISLNFITLLLIVIFITGCSEDDSISDNTQPPPTNTQPPSTNTYEQDKVIVENSIESYLGCMENLERGKLSQLLLDLYDNSENDNSNYHDDIIDAFSNLNIWQSIENLDYPYDLFNFSDYTGTYVYNSSLKTWTTESSNNLIEVLFPIFTNSANNDLRIQLSGVTQELLDIDNPFYIPTSLILDVFYNSERVFGVQIENVEYEILDEIPVPINIDVKIFTSPFTHEIHIDRINSKIFSVFYSLDNGSGCTTEFKSEIELLSSDYENLTRDDIKGVSGYFLMNGLKFNYNGDLEYLLSIDDPSTTQINNYVDIDVLQNDSKIGELKLIEESNGDESIVMVFMDGTEVDWEDINGIGIDAEDLVDRIEGIISRYTNRLDD